MALQYISVKVLSVMLIIENVLVQKNVKICASLQQKLLCLAGVITKPAKVNFLEGLVTSFNLH